MLEIAQICHKYFKTCKNVPEMSKFAKPRFLNNTQYRKRTVLIFTLCAHAPGCKQRIVGRAATLSARNLISQSPQNAEDAVMSDLTLDQD